MKEKVVDFWNRHPVGGAWDSAKRKQDWRFGKEPWIPQIIKGLEPDGKRVLEVGCGTGLDLFYFVRLGAKATGIDISDESLKLAREQAKELGIKNIKLIQGDAENLPFKDDSFDIVYSYGVLHHTPDTEKAVKEAYRVTKGGGQALVMLYSKFSPQYALVSTLRAVAGIVGKERMVKLSNWLLGAGSDENPREGTSISELFECPVLKAYSGRKIRHMFSDFSRLETHRYQFGLMRIFDFMPSSGTIGQHLFPRIKQVDQLLQRRLGFFVVVHAWK